ncbi:MAG: hypothetical protein ACI9N3_001898 [Colwellia sp.]|jgi:hypothetical protein
MIFLSVVTVAVFGYLNLFQDFNDLKKKEEQISSDVAGESIYLHPIKGNETLIEHPRNNATPDNKARTTNSLSINVPITVNKASIKKQKLCISDTVQDESCQVDLALNIEDALIDKITQKANLNEIIVILRSENFSDVSNNLANAKNSESAYERESIFNNQLNDYINSHSNHIQSNGVSCSDHLCIAEFTYNTVEDWDKFNVEYFSDKAKGNTFIGIVNNAKNGLKEARVIFLPGNSNDVVQKFN